MESCIDKKTLELYILGIVRDIKEQESIEGHLETCQNCKNYAEALRTIYRESDKLGDETVDRLSKTLLEKVGNYSTGRVIPLLPIAHKSLKEVRYLLAADSGTNQRYVNVRSYSNVQEDVVARMIKDNESNEVILYLLSEEENRFRDCVLEVEGIAEKFIPDNDNRIMLSDMTLEDFENKNFYLKSALATFDLTPFSDLKESVLAQGQFQVESSEYDRIQIEVEEESGKKIYKVRIVKLKEASDIRQVDVVICQKGDKILSSTAHQGVAVFEEMDLEKILRIKIF